MGMTESGAAIEVEIPRRNGRTLIRKTLHSYDNQMEISEEELNDNP